MKASLYSLIVQGKEITAIKLSDPNFKMIKTVRNGQNNHSLDTQIKDVVKDL